MNSLFMSANKALLVLLLIVSLLIPSFSTPLVYAIDDMDAPDPSDTDPIDNDNGSDNDTDTTSAEPDSDGDGTSDTDEQNAAEEAALEVSVMASAFGVNVNVGAVDTVNNPGAVGGQVTVDGHTMSVENAVSAINSIADTNKLASETGLGDDIVDTEATLENYVTGGIAPGEVVSIHGFSGKPAEVGRYETSYKSDTDGVVSASQISAKNFNDRYNAADSIDWSAYSGSMEEAYFAMSDKLAGEPESQYYVATNDLSTTINESLNSFDFNYTGGYLEYAASIMDAGISDLSGKQIEQTGVVTSDRFDAAFAAVEEVNSDKLTSDVFFSAEPIGGTFNGDTQFGKDTLGKFVQLSPAQRQMLGEPVTKDDWTSSIKDNAANILASENATIAGKIGRGEDLTAEEMAEANAIISVAINRAAAQGVSATDYFTNDIYSNWTIESKNRLAELEQNPEFNRERVSDYYENLFTGQTQTRSFTTTDLQEASPIGLATHYYNPAVASDSTQGKYYVPGTQETLGEHVFSQQYVKDRSFVEYQTKTAKLPDYVTMVSTNPASLEDVTNVTGSGDFYSDKLDTLTDSLIGGDTAAVATNDTGDGPDPTTRGFLGATYEDYVTKEATKETVKQNTECDCVSVAITGDDRPLGVNTSYTEQLDKAMSLVREQFPDAGIKVTVYSGTQVNPNYDPAKKTGTPSGRHAFGNGGDTIFTDKDGNRITDIDINLAITEAIAQVNPKSGVGYSERSNTITHVDFEPNPSNKYHGTWTYGTKDGKANTAIQSAWNTGATNYGNQSITTTNDFKDTNTTKTDVAATQKPSFSIPTLSTPSAKDVGKTVGSVAGAAACGGICSGIGGVIGGVIGDGLSKSGINLNLNFLNLNQNDQNGTPSDNDSNKSCPTTDPDCPGYSSNNQGATVLLSPINPYPTNYSIIQSLMNWLRSDITTNSVKKVVVETITIPVTVTVNVDTKVVTLSREDILQDLEENKDYYQNSISERAAIAALMEETPLVFDDGEIIYSNGIYAPAMNNNQLIESPLNYSYVYAVRYVDKDGNTIPLQKPTADLSDDYLSKLIRAAITSGDKFTIDQVGTVTYNLVDPDTDLAGDEYYDYTITLTSGKHRSVTIPRFSTISLMQNKFSEIGFNGLALDLVNIATEAPPQQKNLDRLLAWAKNLIPEAVVSFFTSPENKSDQFTNLPSSPEAQPELLSLYIYTNTDIECTTNIPGFAYSALVSNPENSDGNYFIADGRCGEGDETAMVLEAINHLQQEYGVSEEVADNVLLNTIFTSQATHYEQNVYRVKGNGNSTGNVTGIADVDVDVDTTDNTDETEYLPNLTNTVVFEIKVTSAGNVTILDWSSTESVTVNNTDNIYLRWDAADYQQCLPFLNDNGHYSLTRENQAMTSGNTETEGYNLTEQNADYRIECGGQRNNEYGVDQRSIEVLVQ